MCTAMNGNQLELVAASQFLAEIDKAKSAEECLDALHRVVLELGWSKFAYGWMPSIWFRTGSPYPVVARGFPAQWDRDWYRHSLNDPYLEAALARKAPFSWNDVRKDWRALRPGQRDCIHYIDDVIGMSEGLTIPVHVSSRRSGFVTLLDPIQHDNFDDQRTSLLRLIAHFFDDRMYEKGCGLVQRASSMSARERECLIWSASGKTTEDIATILAISPETVRVYMKRIQTKLVVSNKTHAVAKALAMGLINVSELH